MPLAMGGVLAGRVLAKLHLAKMSAVAAGRRMPSRTTGSADAKGLVRAICTIKHVHGGGGVVSAQRAAVRWNARL